MVYVISESHYKAWSPILGRMANYTATEFSDGGISITCDDLAELPDAE